MHEFWMQNVNYSFHHERPHHERPPRLYNINSWKNWTCYWLDYTEKLLLNLCSVLPARSFFRFLVTLTLSLFLNIISLLWVIFSVNPCIYSILWFHKTIFPIPMMKMSSTAFYIIDSSWLNLPKNVRVNLIKQDKWFFDINGFLSSGTSKKNLLT